MANIGIYHIYRNIGHYRIDNKRYMNLAVAQQNSQDSLLRRMPVDARRSKSPRINNQKNTAKSIDNALQMSYLCNQTSPKAFFGLLLQIRNLENKKS